MIVSLDARGKTKAIVLLIIVGYVLLKIYRRRRLAALLRTRAIKKRIARDETRKEAMIVLKEVSVSEEQQRLIRSLSASELLNHLRDRKVTAVEAVVTYCLAAERAQEELNCLADVDYLRALRQARDSDARREAGEELGRLEGLPISVKDQYVQEGTDATCGMACRTFRPANYDGLLIDALRNAGAIPFVRTNVPQLLLLPESDNAIYGRTVNPYDHSRSSGGSSGGEGALLAFGGSPLGLGTDIGGSIRIPAHYCGLVGFKPTAGRTTTQGLAGSRRFNVSGQTFIKSTAGPMGRTVDDMVLVLREWWSDYVFARDPLTPKMAFDEELLKGKEGERLRIGYCSFDGWFDCAPSCKRALQEAADALSKAGHVLVPFDVPRAEEMLGMALYSQILSADGSFRHMRRALEGEDLLALYKSMLFQSTAASWLRGLLQPLFRLLGLKRMALMSGSVGAISTDAFWTVCEKAILWKHEWLSQWEEEKLDVLLFPGGALPALPNGRSADLSFSCSYTFLFNLLNFPAGCVPVTITSKGEEAYPSDFNDPVSRAAASSVKGSAGLPVGVQVVALPHRDELALRVMKELESLIKFRQYHEAAPGASTSDCD